MNAPFFGQFRRGAGASDGSDIKLSVAESLDKVGSCRTGSKTDNHSVFDPFCGFLPRCFFCFVHGSSIKK